MIADGKLVSAKLKQKILETTQNIQNKKVCFVIFGTNAGSLQFIRMKCKFADSLGIETKVVQHSEQVSFDEVKNIMEGIASEKYSGVVVQLPLPSHLPTQEVINLIPVEQDIDVLSDKAKEDFLQGKSNRIPPVARAVFEILDFYKINLQDKKILVIGNGKLVGEPVANLLKIKSIPFDVVDINSDAETREKLIANADIIISGAGDPHFIKPEMIKEGVVLIDAGTSESGGKIVGDVDPSCYEKASLVTPVPGGVGPVTLASLFLNL